MILRKLPLVTALALMTIGYLGCGDSGSEDNSIFDAGLSEQVSEPVVEEPVVEQVEIEEAKTVRASSNPGCGSIAFGDGRGGNLWLHHSESTGSPVFLLASSWQDRVTVEAVLKSGGTERGRYTGFANPDGDGRLRQHHRFGRSCGSYTGTLIITDSNQVCEITLPKSPCSRVD